LQKIEWLVNHKILENVETEILIMPLEQALKSGAMSPRRIAKVGLLCRCLIFSTRVALRERALFIMPHMDY